MATSIGNIQLDLGINSSGFKKQLNDVTRTAKKSTGALSGMFGKLGAVISAAFAVKKIVDFSKQCIQLGSDLAEVQNVVDVTFGSMAGKVNEFAKNAMESYGMSEKVAKEYMGQFGAMSKAFGNTEAMAYEQAAALTGLAGDVASFYNITTDEAFTKLKAVYTGETEALKALGVVMTQTALDEYALQKGIGKTTSQMSEQEKVALRLAFVQERLTDASGDFIRTSDGWANQTRVLTLRFDALKATIGQGLINALLPVIRVLNKLLERLQAVADAFYDMTVKIFGDAGASSMSVASDAASVISDSMSDAVSSAKTLKKVLAGFDQLNILSSSNGDGGSGGSLGSSIIPGINTSGVSGSGYDTSAIQETLTKITGIVGIATLALGAILTFSGANIPLGLGLMALGAVSLVAAVAMNWSAVTTQVTTTIDLIMAVISGALLAIGAILTFSGANIPLGLGLLGVGAAGLAATAALNWESATNEVKMAITGIMTAVSVPVLAIGALLALSGANIPLGLGLMIAGAVGLASAVGLNWDSMTKSVNSTVSTIAAIVGGALLGLGAVLTFSGANIPLGLGLMALGAVSLASAIIPNWSGLSDEVKKKITLISGIVGGALLALGIILLLTGVGIPLGLGLIAAGGASLATAIAPNWDKIVNKVKSICEDIGGFFKSMWDGIKGIINNVLTAMESFVNGIIGGINFLIRAINKISFEIPDWVPGIGGKKLGFNLKEVSKVSLPRLATGGYVKANTPQLAIVGDNKREGEIITPESKIADAVAAGFAKIMQQPQSQKQQPMYVTIKIGDNDFWEGFVDYHNERVRQTGESPLLV